MDPVNQVWLSHGSSDLRYNLVSWKKTRAPKGNKLGLLKGIIDPFGKGQI
jgi:hypothetical protein